MHTAAYPDPTRLVNRIRAALKGESRGLDTAKLAWQFADAADRANQALEHCAALAEKKDLLPLVLAEHEHPQLLDTLATLDFPQFQEWSERCVSYSWKQPAKLLLEKKESIQAAIAAQPELKDWLFKQNRAAVRSKDAALSLRIASAIATRFPEDENAKEEAARAKKALYAEAESAVKNGLEELLPTEPPEAIAARYRALGISLIDCEIESVATVARKEQAQRVATLEQSLKKLLDDALALDEKTDIESRYLESDYQLAIQLLRGDIAPELRNELDELGTKLSRLRSSRESIISIRIAIAELETFLATKTQTPSNGRPQKASHYTDKIRSLETQARTSGTQLSPELQQEIARAYNLARSKKLPKRIILAAGTAATAAAAIWAIVAFVERAETERVETEAALALQAALDQDNYKAAQNVLEQWQPTVANSAPESPLRHSSQELETWIATQNATAQQYQSIADTLASIAAGSATTQQSDQVKSLVEQAAQLEPQIAPDLIIAPKAAIAQSHKTWQQKLAASKKASLDAINKKADELKLALSNAAKARNAEEFARINKASERIASEIEELIAQEPSIRLSSDAPIIIAESKQSLSDLSRKWFALDQQFSKLTQAKTLPEYLEVLERIHAFDNLAAKDKEAIDQTLRLKSSFAALKHKELLPDNTTAKQEFASSSNYLTDHPELSKEEAAFLQRLIDHPTFGKIYQSQVQYFEGNAEAKSEYTVLLASPISKIEPSSDNPDMNFRFTVRGFDENGKPESLATESSFLSRADGTFWGFFYKPSKLSDESTYFNNQLKKTLIGIKAGAPRTTIAALIKELDTKTDISPALRIYWQQQLFAFTSLNPWKWALTLSGSASAKANALKNFADGNLSESHWLSNIEQTIPSIEFTEYFEAAPKQPSIETELKAYATLFEEALQGDFTLVGHVDVDGKTKLIAQPINQDPFWTVNALTGQIEIFDKTTKLTPFAPILQYRYEEGGRDALLKKVSYLTNYTFAKETAPSYLPAFYLP